MSHEKRNLENLGGGGGGKQDFFEKLWSHISSQGKQRKAYMRKREGSFNTIIITTHILLPALSILFNFILVSSTVEMLEKAKFSSEHKKPKKRPTKPSRSSFFQLVTVIRAFALFPFTYVF